MDTERDEKGKFVKGSKVNQGRIPSSEQRRKQAEAMSGRSLTVEHKDKIQTAMLALVAEGKTVGRPKGGTPWNKGKGTAVKKERFLNDAKFKKGMKPWNTGKPWSEEVLIKMRGRHQSEESKAKMSKSHTGKKLTAEHIRKCLSRRTPTSLEMKFQGIIDKNGLPYKFVGDGSFMIGRKNPDFININGEKTAIEVYARYYKLRHAETVQEWKEERQRVFGEYGWTAIFFDETQVNEENVMRQLMAA